MQSYYFPLFLALLSRFVSFYGLGNFLDYTIDYSKSPAKAFDAVEDIKDYLGDRYDHMVELIENVSDCERFAFYCSMMGISGFPVKAWYEHFHGQNSFKGE